MYRGHGVRDSYYSGHYHTFNFDLDHYSVSTKRSNCSARGKSISPLLVFDWLCNHWILPPKTSYRSRHYDILHRHVQGNELLAG